MHLDPNRLKQSPTQRNLTTPISLFTSSTIPSTTSTILPPHRSAASLTFASDINAEQRKSPAVGKYRKHSPLVSARSLSAQLSVRCFRAYATGRSYETRLHGDSFASPKPSMAISGGTVCPDDGRMCADSPDNSESASERKFGRIWPSSLSTRHAGLYSILTLCRRPVATCKSIASVQRA